MAAQPVCLRCRETMIRGHTKGTFNGRRSDGMVGVTQTVKYMCPGCGYIEERAVNARHLLKSLDYISSKGL